MAHGTNQEIALEFDQHPAKTAQVRLRDFPRGSLRYITRRAGFNFFTDGGTDLAASLTFFTVLSIFPAMLAFISVLGVFGRGQESATFILELLRENSPQQMYSLLEEPIRQLTDGHSAGLVLLAGILSALWSASGYTGSFGRAINRIYGVREGRPGWVLKPYNMLITTALVILAVLMTFMMLVGVSVLNTVGRYLPATVDMELVKVLWLNGRWLVIFAAAIAAIAMLYTATPNIRREKVRRMTPGAFVALTGMALGGLGFTIYANNFGKYNATYGLIGGVIVTLLFTWIMNIMLLFGAHLDAEIERMRQLVAGEHSAVEIRVALRNTQAIKKMDRTNEQFISAARILQHRSGGQQIMPKPKGPSLARQVSQQVTATMEQVQEKADQVFTMFEDAHTRSANTSGERPGGTQEPKSGSQSESNLASRDGDNPGGDGDTPTVHGHGDEKAKEDPKLF